jgi:hypothetical protein
MREKGRSNPSYRGSFVDLNISSFLRSVKPEQSATDTVSLNVNTYVDVNGYTAGIRTPDPGVVRILRLIRPLPSHEAMQLIDRLEVCYKSKRLSRIC